MTTATSRKHNVPAVWDVVVIGGGPAGMMAAAVAAGRHKRVLLLEKNSSVGKKLLITGGGRCNVTNNKPEVRRMLAQYKDASKYLHSAFTQHAVAESIAWFRERGVLLVEENEGRLFPQSNSAQTIWDTLVAELQSTGVIIQSKATVQSVRLQSDGLFSLQLQNATEVLARACVIAAGGTSRPETG